MSTAVIPRDIIVAAQRTQARYGCYASVTCAQWALESAWGAHVSGKNNPFGIKARPGDPCTSCMTWEVIGGVRHSLMQNFRDFASLDEAFDQHGKLLATGSAYALARGYIGRHDAAGYANALTGHYATDPLYGAKLISIMEKHKLYQFDVAVADLTPVTEQHAGVQAARAPAAAAPRRGVWASLWAALTGKAA